MAHRHPNDTMLDAAPNFRDLAGIAGADGRMVHAGQVLRSSLLTHLPPADLQHLARYPVRWVCDLRSPEERAQASGTWPPAAAAQTIIAAQGADMGGARPAAWHERLQDPAFDEAAARNYMFDAYRRMPQAFASVLAQLFGLLAREGQAPVLVHCVAGKDRTGFVCAMLLWALGATQEAIRADYLASHVYAQRQSAHGPLALPAGVVPSARALAARAMLARVDEAYLDAALSEVTRRHGNVQAYLQQVAGLDDALRGKLRARLLVDA